MKLKVFETKHGNKDYFFFHKHYQSPPEDINEFMTTNTVELHGMIESNDGYLHVYIENEEGVEDGWYRSQEPYKRTTKDRVTSTLLTLLIIIGVLILVAVW